jgi:hypothetical protein
MRRLAPIVAVLVASPAFAQSSVVQLQEMIAADTVGAGFAPEVAEAVATCFTSRMTEADAAAVLASDDLTAQQQALVAIPAYTEAVACAAEELP